MTATIKKGQPGKRPGDIFPWPGMTPPKGAMPLNGGYYPIASYPKLAAVLQGRYDQPAVPPGHFRIPGAPGAGTWPNAATAMDATLREMQNSTSGNHVPLAGGASVYLTADMGASDHEYVNLIASSTSTTPNAVVILPAMKRVFVPFVIMAGAAGGIGTCRVSIGLTGRSPSTGDWLCDIDGENLMKHAALSLQLGQNLTGAGHGNWSIRQRAGDGAALTETALSVSPYSGEPGFIASGALLIDFENGQVGHAKPDGSIEYVTTPLTVTGTGAGLSPILSLTDYDSGTLHMIQVDCPTNEEIFRGTLHPLTMQPINTGFRALIEAGWVNVWDAAYVGAEGGFETVLWCIQHKG